MSFIRIHLLSKFFYFHRLSSLKSLRIILIQEVFSKHHFGVGGGGVGRFVRIYVYVEEELGNLGSLNRYRKKTLPKRGEG